jgi:hypothetical protein
MTIKVLDRTQGRDCFKDGYIIWLVRYEDHIMKIPTQKIQTLNPKQKRKIDPLRATMWKSNDVNCMDEYNVMQKKNPSQ